MKQKIVMKVQMNCEKCRSKAMKHAVLAEGVTSVAIEGADKDQVVVIGDGVDSASLTHLLRKKLGNAILVSVAEEKGKGDKKKEEKEYSTSSYIHYPQYAIREVYDPNPTVCSIM